MSNIEDKKREYYFKKGNTFGKGRPGKSKNQLETIRRRILKVVQRRLWHEKDLGSVTTTDLLKFLASIMPKDVGLKLQSPQINYISNVPREVKVLEDNTTENGTEDNGNGTSKDEVLLRSELHSPDLGELEGQA